MLYYLRFGLGSIYYVPRPEAWNLVPKNLSNSSPSFRWYNKSYYQKSALRHLYFSNLILAGLFNGCLWSESNTSRYIKCIWKNNILICASEQLTFFKNLITWMVRQSIRPDRLRSLVTCFLVLDLAAKRKERVSKKFNHVNWVWMYFVLFFTLGVHILNCGHCVSYKAGPLKKYSRCKSLPIFWESVNPASVV